MTHINKIVRLAFCFCALVFLSGCATRVGDLTLASTKNIDLTNTHLNAKQGIRVSGHDCKWQFLGIPMGEPNLKDAIDNALTNGNSNLLVDEVTRLKAVNFIVVGKTCYVVEGTALNVATK
jgi:hypothetical protein